MATTYTLRGWDLGAARHVYWQSENAPDLTPATTSPPLVGSLVAVVIIDDKEHFEVEAAPGPGAVVPMVFDGFNENIVYWDANGAKVPNFVTLDDGNFMTVRVTNE